MSKKKAKDVKKGNIIWCGPKQKNLGKVTSVVADKGGYLGEIYNIEFKFLDGKKSGKTESLVLKSNDEVSYKPEKKEPKFKGEWLWFMLVMGWLSGVAFYWAVERFPNGLLH